MQTTAANINGRTTFRRKITTITRKPKSFSILELVRSSYSKQTRDLPYIPSAIYMSMTMCAVATCLNNMMAIYAMDGGRAVYYIFAGIVFRLHVFAAAVVFIVRRKHPRVLLLLCILHSPVNTHTHTHTNRKNLGLFRANIAIGHLSLFDSICPPPLSLSL